VVISTLIISAVVLAVTAVASFLGMNVLELQSQLAEFDQAKTNMQILGEVIEDIGVKPGSGSFIRFNERTGGLGYVVDGEPMKLVVTDGTTLNEITLSNSPMSMTYRGGRLVGTYDTIIKGDENLIVSGLARPLGFLRQQQSDGAWLVLDFNRIRIVDGTIVNVGGDQYYLVTVTFFNVTHGTFRGSGNLDVKVQNIGMNQPIQLPTYYNQVTISVSCNGVTETSPPITQPPETEGVIVMVTVSNVEVSTL